MKIKVSNATGVWSADCEDVAGSPPIGIGNSKEEAIACLWRDLYCNKMIDQVNYTSPIEIIVEEG